MKAVEANLLKFLQQPKQLVIPIYQRMYNWELAQCQQLWRDILRVGKDASATGHFIGSVVYIAKGIYSASSVPQLLLIDGQQRLTTISLLLSAFSKVIVEKDADIGISRKKLENYYLFNAEETGEIHYKLLLTRGDKETLIRIVEDRDLPDKPAIRLEENYKFFEEQLLKSSTDLEQVYEGLQKLIIVDISLDRDHDNPQLIFESLNATGLKLSQADLIRNYILMGLEPIEQQTLYEDYWYRMEQAFGQTYYAEWFDSFMRDYLTVKTGNIPNIREVYATFKTYCQSVKSAISIADIVAEIYRFSRHYIRFVLDKEPDAELRSAFGNINTLQVNVAFPFFLELYEDYTSGLIDHSILLEILRLVESYVFRRSICGIPTNSLNKTFAALSREIDKNAYLDSFKAALMMKDSYRRFPDDDEFKRELMVKDVYKSRSRNYLLARLENHERKEPVSVETFTIEHIMPQNKSLRSEWKVALGDNWQEVQAKYLHTLGNLTLTGYNSEYSDRPFLEKRDITGGFHESPLRLNQGLAQLATWNEEQIVKRAAALADKSIMVWKSCALPSDVLAKYKPSQQVDDAARYAVQEHLNNLEPETYLVFQEFRKRVLNLDASVREEAKKVYIAYKTSTNFVDVICQKKRLVLTLNMNFDEINDPKGLCKNVAELGRWGNGDVSVSLATIDEMEDVMALVHQSFARHIYDEDE